MKTAEVLTLSGILLSAFGVIGTLLLNGARTERDHRRALYARAMAAVRAYYEMPFAVRRRMHEPATQSTERVRLSDRFAEVQAELSTCQTLIQANGDPRVAEAFDDLIGATREIAGGETRAAWTADPITEDRQMNMPEVRARLEPLDAQMAEFAEDIGEASGYLWQWQRPYDRQVYGADRRRSH